MYRDIEALRKLKRTELQQIAAQENIKANQKSATIIQQLLDKYPRGVPRKATPAVSFGPRTQRSTKAVPGQASRSFPLKHTADGGESPTRDEQGGDDEPISSGSLPRTRQSRTAQQTETTEERATRLPKRARVSDHDAVIPSPQKKQRVGPSAKNVRYVLREMKQHVDELPKLQDSVCEIADLLEEAQQQMAGIHTEAEEMVWLRWCVEEDVVKKMKKDQSLIDGTTLLGSDSEKGAAWRKSKEGQQSSKGETAP
ncbi:hypothetical protein V5O48_011009 [Marasmius crinis-equi]|uniref:Uncharacterized protein n=1 Tax=Marasmius crinis-equi TaxID=585013 RepID=A0ABR3F6R8_9AGAR